MGADTNLLQALRLADYLRGTHDSIEQFLAIGHRSDGPLPPWGGDRAADLMSLVRWIQDWGSWKLVLSTDDSTVYVERGDRDSNSASLVFPASPAPCVAIACPGFRSLLQDPRRKREERLLGIVYRRVDDDDLAAPECAEEITLLYETDPGTVFAFRSHPLGSIRATPGRRAFEQKVHDWLRRSDPRLNSNSSNSVSAAALGLILDFGAAEEVLRGINRHLLETSSAGTRSPRGASSPTPTSGDVSVWDVSIRVGSTLSAQCIDRSSECATVNDRAPPGHTVKPHVRRGHMHTFRTGPGRKEKVVRWVNAVAVKGHDGLVPTVRRVGRETP